MSDEPVMATTWEQCARHVERGGVVEVNDHGWAKEYLTAVSYRMMDDGRRPGDGSLPRRLLPLPATASDPSVAIEVPEGHEMVVLPCETVDEVRGWKAGAGLKVPATDWQTIWHLASGCKAAVARRPKPAPKTERVPWGDNLIGRRVPQNPQPIDYVHRTPDGIHRYGSLLGHPGGRWEQTTTRDGTVEVLIEDLEDDLEDVQRRSHR